jgi:dTMP kinase
MDPDAAFKRVAERALEDGLALTGDRFEKEEIEWHKRLRDAFLAIARDNPDRCVVISASQSVEALEAAIWEAVSQRFPELLRGSQA